MKDNLSESASIITDVPVDNNGELKKITEVGLKKADAIHATLSNSLSASADWIDSFFREERAQIEEDNSNLRLKFSWFKESGEDIDFMVKAQFHFVLPNLERRLHLFASSILDEDGKDIDDFDSTDEDDDDSKNFYLSLRYFIKSAERKNLSLRAGLKFHKLVPALFAGPRISYLKKWSSWNFRFIEDMTYFTDNGWESATSFDFEKTFSGTLFYRTNFTGRWRENERGYLYWVDTNLYHAISDNKAVNYRIRSVFETYPENQLSHLTAGVRYRQGFWRKWLFFEISPQIAFRKEKDYEPLPGITLSLEVFFGKEFMDYMTGP